MTIAGMHNLHLKESDRVAAVEAALQVLDRSAQRVGAGRSTDRTIGEVACTR